MHSLRVSLGISSELESFDRMSGSKLYTGPVPEGSGKKEKKSINEPIRCKENFLYFSVKTHGKRVESNWQFAHSCLPALIQAQKYAP